MGSVPEPEWHTKTDASLVRVAVETFREGRRDAALHTHVEAGDGALGHRLREQVEAVHQAFGTAVKDGRGRERAQTYTGRGSTIRGKPANQPLKTVTPKGSTFNNNQGEAHPKNCGESRVSTGARGFPDHAVRHGLAVREPVLIHGAHKYRQMWKCTAGCARRNQSASAT